MSTVETNQREWPNKPEENLVAKYEKCRNITEEIYKRIDITFQIKKLEAGLSELSDNSDQIDSNELSNETDLFACDKSDLTSSTEAERPPTDCGKFININNNEERNKPVYKRPRKRFRKRVKKRVVRTRSESDGSSDEAPLSRIADENPQPPVLIVAQIGSLLKQKPEKRPPKKSASKAKPAKKNPTDDKTVLNKTLSVTIDKLPIKDVLSMAGDTLTKNYRSFMKDNKLTIKSDPKDLSGVASAGDKVSADNEISKNADWKNCKLCSCSFRGERGLRRHMSISHILPDCN